MEQESQRNKGGRPATGRTPARTVKLGAIWDRCAKLAFSRGETMTALVERALIAEEKRILRKRRADADESKARHDDGSPLGT